MQNAIIIYRLRQLQVVQGEGTLCEIWTWILGVQKMHALQPGESGFSCQKSRFYSSLAWTTLFANEARPLDRMEKCWSPFLHKFFHAEFAILHQNWRGCICVNIGQDIVREKLLIFTKPNKGYWRKWCFICWSKSYLSKSTRPYVSRFAFTKFWCHLTFCSLAHTKYGAYKSMAVLITGGSISFFSPVRPSEKHSG